MREFLVTWTINLMAETPEDAAEESLRIHRDPASIATVFNVSDKETGKYTEVDLTPEAAEDFSVTAKREPPSLGKLLKLFDRVKKESVFSFRVLSMALLTRAAEIDSDITKSAYYGRSDNDDRIPTGDDYNLLFDAIMDEITALLTPEA